MGMGKTGKVDGFALGQRQYVGAGPRRTGMGVNNAQPTARKGDNDGFPVAGLVKINP